VSPAHLKYANDTRGEEEKGEHLIVGSAAHTYILEPDEFYSTYLIAPTSDKRKKEWKDFIKNIKDDERDKPILRQSDVDMFKGMVKSLRREGYGGRSRFNIYDGLIHNKDTKRELAIYTVDKKRGILLKLKADIFVKGIFFDLKTTKSANIDSFMKDAANMSYDLQAAFYMKVAGMAGKDPKGFGFIAIEKTEPYFSSAVVLTAADVSLAEAETERLLDVYTNCIRTDYWYGYNGFDSYSGIEPLYRVKSLPEWHRYKREQSIGFRGA